ncbi:SDR family oxidoreductase [Paenibacillus frigoriresistens]|uniref:SDR family oxidoreductase n=1 Tax=Paenibacillus alginolyticus TaxID=59839 RepID=UPI00156395E7|nr:SDR family oxidoreductase [Paenibacillus frigoriresistens]NRF94691.1 SDR family oxidoreductase [Paenibacillus frigoriresistens]
MSLQNHRAVIVGGTSGIGLATAKLFLSRGAQVMVASRSQEKVDAAVKDLGSAQGYALDFQDESQMKLFFEKIGDFDHLVVTAAGGGSTNGPFGSLGIDVARAEFDGKFWGQYTTVKAALPYIKESGSITLTSGVLAARPTKGASTLVALNSAIEGFARVLAMDLAPIRVNVVSPGMVDTPVYSGMGMDTESLAAMFQTVAQSLLIQHVAKPEEIAEAYVYLATNTYTTGSVLQVEGGAILAGI